MTQHDMILDYLKAHGTITSLEAANKLNITKLTTRVSEMREKGINIKSIRVDAKNEYGKPIHYNRYFIGGGGTCKTAS